MAESSNVNANLGEGESVEVNRHEHFTEEDLDERILMRYNALLEEWENERIENLRPILPALRQIILIMAVLDKAFAKIGIFLYFVIGWAYFLNRDILEITNNWSTSTSLENEALKTQIEVMSFAFIFFLMSFAYTAIFHRYYIIAVDQKSIMYLTWQFCFEGFIILTLGIIPVGYQMLAEIILGTYLWNLYRGNQKLITEMENANILALEHEETDI